MGLYPGLESLVRRAWWRRRIDFTNGMLNLNNPFNVYRYYGTVYVAYFASVIDAQCTHVTDQNVMQKGLTLPILTDC